MSYHITKVGSESLTEVKSIMEDVYKENPSHWPNGLSTDQMDGGVWLVRSASSDKPVGFVAWQDRREGFNKVGYYSIGIKKEHRRQGYAREAVKKIINIKSSSVDKVRALVEESNIPSLELAKQLPVELQLEKQANWAKLKSLFSRPEPNHLLNTLAGAGVGAGVGGLESWAFDYDPTATKVNTFLSGVMGGAWPHMKGKGKLIHGPYGKKLELATANVPKMGIVAAVDMADKYIGSQQGLSDARLDTARLQEETAKIYKKIVDDYGLPALLSAGVLGTGATSALLINALKTQKPTKITMSNPKGGKKNVITVDIPKEHISEDFYRSLSRDLLFDSPEEKRRKAKAVLARPPAKKKASLNKEAGSGTHFWNALKLLGGSAKATGEQTGKFLTSNNKFWGNAAKLGIGAGGLYGGLNLADLATPGWGNWGNRFFGWAGQPFTDAAKDFGEGKILHGLGNLGAGALWALPAAGTLGLASRAPAILAAMGSKGLGRALAGRALKGKMPTTAAGLTGLQALGVNTYNMGRKFKNLGKTVEVAGSELTQPYAAGLGKILFSPFGAKAESAGAKLLKTIGASHPTTFKTLGVNPLLGMGASAGGFYGAEALKSPLSRESRGLANQLKIDQMESSGLLPKGSGFALAKFLGANPFSAA
jgi:hypothetical protein